jgi:hypothetical protein
MAQKPCSLDHLQSQVVSVVTCQSVSRRRSGATASYYSPDGPGRIDIRMDSRLESLVSCADPKEFVAQFKGLREAYSTIDLFLTDLVPTLATRLYEPSYDHAPRGAYGLTCASLAESLFPAEDRWRPYAQQLWGLRGQRKRTRFRLAPSPAAREAEVGRRWAEFRTAVLARDPEHALSLAQAFLGDPDARDFFRARLLMLALSDPALGGHKFNYVVQSWMLAERLGFRHAELALFGPLHLLCVADRRAEDAALEAGPLPPLAELVSGLDPKLEAETEQALLGGTGEEAVRALRNLLDRRIGLASVFDLLLMSAGRVLAAARRGAWLSGARAFHAAFFCAEYSDWFEPEDRAKAALLTGALINRASRESRAVGGNPPLDEVIQRLCPARPFEVLRSVISHSDPYASATAVYAILGMDDHAREALFQTLAAEAAKTDGDNCWGHGILLVSQARACYRRSTTACRDLFPAVAGFVLAQIPKSYSLSTEYGV